MRVAESSNLVVARAASPAQAKTEVAAQPAVQEGSKDGFAQNTTEDLGLMTKPQAQAPAEERMSPIAAGALYGALAGLGVSVALGAATFGVGLVTAVATVPAGLAIGTLGGAAVELYQAARD